MMKGPEAASPRVMWSTGSARITALNLEPEKAASALTATLRFSSSLLTRKTPPYSPSESAKKATM